MLKEHIFSRWNSQSLYRDIKYSLEISLMSLVIQSIRPNHFNKELLKFIFYEIRFHKIYMNNLED